jgi:hypothetical protein
MLVNLTNILVLFLKTCMMVKEMRSLRILFMEEAAWKHLLNDKRICFVKHQPERRSYGKKSRAIFGLYFISID